MILPCRAVTVSVEIIRIERLSLDTHREFTLLGSLSDAFIRDRMAVLISQSLGNISSNSTTGFRTSKGSKGSGTWISGSRKGGGITRDASPTQASPAALVLEDDSSNPIPTLWSEIQGSYHTMIIWVAVLSILLVIMGAVNFTMLRKHYCIREKESAKQPLELTSCAVNLSEGKSDMSDKE